MDVELLGMDFRTDSSRESSQSKRRRKMSFLSSRSHRSHSPSKRRSNITSDYRSGTLQIGDFEDIPNVIHQIWIDKRGDSFSYPERYEKNRQTFAKTNPEFKMLMWLGEDVDKLFSHPELVEFKDVYRVMSYPISKADFARFMVLYIHGGWYFDLDFQCLKPLASLRERFIDKRMMFVMESKDHFNAGERLCNGFAAVPPRHPFILGWLREMAESMKSHNGSPYVNVIHTTGPRAFFKYAESSIYPWKEWIIPTTYILPLNDRGQFISEFTDLGDATDSPYVFTDWKEGTRWSDDIVWNIAVETVRVYVVVVIAVTLLVLIIFGWKRGLSLCLSQPCDSCSGDQCCAYTPSPFSMKLLSVVG